MGSSFPEGFRVLVVDDDATCLKVVGRMLQHCKYTVTLCNQPRDALNLLRRQRGSFDLVISDVRMPGMDGFKLLEHIELELDLPVIMMSADDERDTVMKSLTQGACFYLVKPIKMDQLIGIWQYVIKRRQERMKDIEQAGSVEDNEQQRNAAPREEEEVAQNKVVEEDGCAASANEGNWKKTKKRKKVIDHVGGEEENDDASMQKKPRVLWSTELHDQFIIAVNRIGIDRAVPKKILEFMKVPGLSRENVASHLQKYRLYLKRVEEAKFCAAVGTKPQNRVPMKSIFGSVPSQVMLHTRQHSSILPQFTTQLGPSAFGLQPYKAMGTSRPSMNHHLLTNSLPRLRYNQNQLLNNQVMANSISNSRSSLPSRSFLPVNFNNHTTAGFQHQPLPSTSNNCSLGMLNNIGTATLGHNQMFQNFRNAGLPTNTATGMGMVGNSSNNGSTTGAQFTDVGADGRGVPLPEFSASDYITGMGEMDAPEVLPDGTHGLRTFTDLIQSDIDDVNNDHLKFGEESLSDVLTGFTQFTGTGDLEDIFKQRQDENNEDVDEKVFQYR